MTDERIPLRYLAGDSKQVKELEEKVETLISNYRIIGYGSAIVSAGMNAVKITPDKHCKIEYVEYFPLDQEAAKEGITRRSSSQSTLIDLDGQWYVIEFESGD